MRAISDYIFDIQNWATEILTEPSEEFGGVSPGTIAKSSWDRGLVSFGVFLSLDDIRECIDFFPDTSRDIFIGVLSDVEGCSSPDLSTFIETLNKNLPLDDVLLSGHHPGDEHVPEYPDVEWVPCVEEPYAIIFIQRLSKYASPSYNPWTRYCDIVHHYKGQKR